MPTAYKLYRFAEFTLNPVKRTLSRNGEEIKLTGKDFDVLLFLVENSPRFCSFDEIIEAVWKGVAVSNSSVEKAISNIRKALSEGKNNLRFIKNERKIGYTFICEVQEIEELTLPLNGENLQHKKNEFNQLLHYKKPLVIKIIGLSLFLILSIGIFLWKGGDIWARFNTATVFADEFSGDEIDLTRWTATGSSVEVKEGILKLSADETDKAGKIYSTYFTINPSKPIIIKSRIKITFSQNMKDETYFGGGFLLIPKLENSDEKRDFADDDEEAQKFFGVRYMKYDSRASFLDPTTGEPLQEVPTEGFFLIKAGGHPNIKSNYTKGKISQRIEPLWGQWFDQKIIYNPADGEMLYFVNNEKRGEFNVGRLEAKDNRICLAMSPWGWWVNHSIEIDYVEVTQ